MAASSKPAPPAISAGSAAGWWWDDRCPRTYHSRTAAVPSICAGRYLRGTRCSINVRSKAGQPAIDHVSLLSPCSCWWSSAHISWRISRHPGWPGPRSRRIGL